MILSNTSFRSNNSKQREFRYEEGEREHKLYDYNDFEDNYPNQDYLEPLITSTTKNNQNKYSSSGRRVHEYQINPMLEHGPELTKSFREKKAFRHIYKDQSI